MQLSVSPWGFGPKSEERNVCGVIEYRFKLTLESNWTHYFGFRFSSLYVCNKLINQTLVGFTWPWLIRIRFRTSFFDNQWDKIGESHPNEYEKSIMTCPSKHYFWMMCKMENQQIRAIEILECVRAIYDFKNGFWEFGGKLVPQSTAISVFFC